MGFNSGFKGLTVEYSCEHRHIQSWCIQLSFV